MGEQVGSLNQRRCVIVCVLRFCIAIGRGSFGEPDFHAGAAELRFSQGIDTGGGRDLSVLDGERLVMNYHCAELGLSTADVLMKPCVDKLFTPAGVQVLRDSPSDHKHHHALMFAAAIDGANFWEETRGATGVATSGVERHKAITEMKSTVRDGVARAGLAEELEWLVPAPYKLLAIERREIQVIQAADLGATLLDWRSRLQPPPGKDSMTLTSGHHYYGLGMRFVQSMDEGGRFFNADDKTGEIVRGDERLTPAKWCAYTAKADGKPVTVAIFDHSQNPRYPARMFTMSKPFAYLSATRNEWKEPLEVKADKPLELTYGVALWDGEVDKATVEKLYQRWLQLSTGETKK